MTSATLEHADPALRPSARSGSRARHTMLDVCRLVAAYAIVWLHTPRPAEWADLGLLGRFAVPFFTAVAAYFAWQAGARPSERTLTLYARSRLLRIYVPFLAWSGIYLAFKAAKALLLPGEPNVFPGLSVLWLGSFYHLWFMPFVLLVTLAVFAMARSCGSKAWRRQGILGLTLVAGGVVALWPFDHSTAEATFTQLAIDALPSAFWGVALAIACQANGRRCLSDRRVGAACLVTAVALTLALSMFGRNRAIENLSGVALMIFTLGDWTSPVLERIARLGPLAYGIYLSHLLFIKTFESVASKLHVGDSLPTSIGVFALAAAGSTLLAWLLGRWRATRWLTAS